MITKWEKTGQTKAPISKVIEFFMNAQNPAKVQPKLKAGALSLFMKGRAKKTFEDTVDEDMKALDALPWDPNMRE